MVMQATDFREFYDLSHAGRLQRSRFWAIHPQWQMRPPAVIVVELANQHPFQMAFVQDDDMVQAITPDAADHAFHKRILPRAARRSEYLFDTQAFHAPPKLASIHSVSIPKQVLRSRIPRKPFDDLLSGPLGGGMLRDMEVHHPATVVSEDHQNEQHFESYGRHHKEIDRYQVRDMIFQESLPGRRRWLFGPYPVLVYGGFGNINAEFPQLPDNPGRTPARIGYRYLADQRLDFFGYRRSTRSALLTQFGPMIPKVLALPGDHGPGLNKHQCALPTGPATRKPGPEHTVCRLNPGMPGRSLIDGELMA
jgi:hypothetical protein